MKLYAQSGHGPANRITDALKSNLISGVVLSPRHSSPERLVEIGNEIIEVNPETFVCLDPQLYLAVLKADQNPRIRSLPEYPYFRQLRRGQLDDPDRVDNLLREAISFQEKLPVSSVVAPNIVIQGNFNSQWASISKVFIRRSLRVHKSQGARVPLLCTLAIDSAALADPTEVNDFLVDLSELEEKPSGFYLVLGSFLSQPQFEKHLANALMIVYSLSVNGYSIVLAFADLLAPLFGAVGVTAACSGWSSSTRSFSLENYVGSNSGPRRAALRKYLSIGLLNRVDQRDLPLFKKLVPEILNGSTFDRKYLGGDVSSADECLQSWEALKNIDNTISGSTVASRLDCYEERVNQALLLMTSAPTGAPIAERQTKIRILESIMAGVRRFRNDAEL